MRTFRGNCQQVAIMEAQVTASGLTFRVESGDNAPLFEVQKEFRPMVLYRKYWIRTDSNNRFIPKVYTMKFVYDQTLDQGEVHMDREVIDRLLELVPEQMQKLEVLNGDKDKAK